jgi:hypothetical protein
VLEAKCRPQVLERDVVGNERDDVIIIPAEIMEFTEYFKGVSPSYLITRGFPFAALSGRFQTRPGLLCPLPFWCDTNRAHFADLLTSSGRRNQGHEHSARGEPSATQQRGDQSGVEGGQAGVR